MALSTYLEECVAGIPRAEMDFPWVLYAEHPASASGRVLRCLAASPSSSKIALMFYGNPGANGVLSAALGLRAKWLASSQSDFPPRMFTADEQRCQPGQTSLYKHGLLQFVDFHCQSVCADKEQEACAKELRVLVCPSGRLDVLAIDSSLGEPLVPTQLVKACNPKVLFVENSGLRYWRVYPEMLEEDRWTRCNGLGEAPAQACFADPTLNLYYVGWHVYEEHELYRPAVQGRGPFALAVDRALSGMRVFENDPDPFRRFSVYVARS